MHSDDDGILLKKRERRTQGLSSMASGGNERVEYRNKLRDLENREISPEDYDLLFALDGLEGNLDIHGSLGGVGDCKVKGSGRKELKRNWRTWKLKPKGDAFENSECSICYSALAGGQVAVELPCTVKHIFHKKCLEKWYSSSNRCPLDNQNMDLL
jgi:hypothetical protein